LGIVFCTLAGGLGYTRRFYGEVLADPVTASPVLFPETVFNAPASHIGAVLGSREPNYTLVGPPRMFAQGLAVAAAWLQAGEVDACVVVAAEELDWLVTDGHRLFSHRVVAAEGAGAVYLKRRTAELPDAVLILGLPKPAPGASPPLLCDGATGIPRLDAVEARAWRHWTSPRWSPQAILGHGLTAAAGWQTVLAAEAIRQGGHAAAQVGLPTATGRADGVTLARPDWLSGGATG
jgi:3-oxoacyl-(acyl-carrier-protein) synthase